jgi:hypothetical protein
VHGFCILAVRVHTCMILHGLVDLCVRGSLVCLLLISEVRGSSSRSQASGTPVRAARCVAEASASRCSLESLLDLVHHDVSVTGNWLHDVDSRCG